MAASDHLSQQQFAAEQANKRLAYARSRADLRRQDTDKWTVEVDHSSHDDLKEGRTMTSRSKVVLSREHYPDPAEAEHVAALMGLARGTYVTRSKLS